MKKSVAAKSPRSGPYRFVGTTKEGVEIPAPKLKPTHFTASKIRSIVRAAKATAGKGTASTK